jgi:hypothetical protein
MLLDDKTAGNLSRAKTSLLESAGVKKSTLEK